MPQFSVEEDQLKHDCEQSDFGNRWRCIMNSCCSLSLQGCEIHVSTKPLYFIALIFADRVTLTCFKRHFEKILLKQPKYQQIWLEKKSKTYASYI